MAAIRPIDQIANKWATVTPQRTQDFQRGVQQPRQDWEQQTSQAAESWEQGVQRAIQEGSFGRGVQQAGTQKWQQRTLQVGVQRWGPGVQAAESSFSAGFRPFRDAIERLQLPPRFARRDPRNLERVRSVVEAMIQTAQSQGG